ncbi:MAG: hypothetical protein ACR2F1_06495 [Nitrososphaeraceae archaeon]
MRNRKIYSYQPIENEILHNYNQNISIQHYEPYNTVIGDNRIVISRLRNVVELPLTLNNSQISSGTCDCVRSALVFQKTDSTPPFFDNLFSIYNCKDITLFNTIKYIKN